jgi:ABC-type multidrug transport system ATPase subunit
VPLPDPPPRLTVRGLTKDFGSRTVLGGVDLDVAPGSIVLLTGSNGSGKTTLLRCLAGLARYGGTVVLDGEMLDGGGTSHPRIGYLPQSLGLPAWASVSEVLALFGRLRGDVRTAVALPDGFLPSGEQLIGRLSGGQRQRVAFAVALLGRPSLLLLDEPAANLDDDGRAAMVETLETVREAGASVLVAAPSPGDLNGLPDRTVRLVAGAVADGSQLRVVRTEPGRPDRHPPSIPQRSDDQEVSA